MTDAPCISLHLWAHESEPLDGPATLGLADGMTHLALDARTRYAKSTPYDQVTVQLFGPAVERLTLEAAAPHPLIGLDLSELMLTRPGDPLLVTVRLADALADQLRSVLGDGITPSNPTLFGMPVVAIRRGR